MNTIATSLAEIRLKIRDLECQYGRAPGSVRLIAVSKTRPPDDIIEAWENGQRDFGENYLQEALEKIHGVEGRGIIWHFIGPVQSNKARLIAENFDWVHSLDRAKIAQRLNAARPPHLPPLNVLIQVNIGAEDTKSGILPAGLPQLLATCRHMTRLRVRGLMALPAPVTGLEQQRRPFREIKKLFDSINIFEPALDTLSLGTSADMEAAIAEGATMVRIGTALFGLRG